ncbi:MAG: helix-hairpin-helix domain-containing protein [Anaerorhabdus sp.]
MKLLIFLCFYFICLSKISWIVLEDPRDVDIVVTVNGFLEKPGKYTVKNFTLTQDLLEQLNIYENADLRHLNGAVALHDGDVLTIVEKQEKHKISINLSSKEELMKLRGIGEMMAQRIVEYREKYGYFQQLEDLKKVKGIGDKKFEQIKAEIIL